MSLADQQCSPCRGGVPPLPQDEAERLLGELDRDWHLNPAGHLERKLPFGNFAMAMDFANRVAALAEAENHHPDLHVAWGRCTVEIWTHKIDGLTESDFVFAAKVDRLREAFGQKLR
jgi:4a-hydroxytetrahydrobiopterin dehydratase